MDSPQHHCSHCGGFDNISPTTPTYTGPCWDGVICDECGKTFCPSHASPLGGPTWETVARPWEWGGHDCGELHTTSCDLLRRWTDILLGSVGETSTLMKDAEDGAEMRRVLTKAITVWGEPCFRLHIARQVEAMARYSGGEEWWTCLFVDLDTEPQNFRETTQLFLKLRKYQLMVHDFISFGDETLVNNGHAPTGLTCDPLYSNALSHLRRELFPEHFRVEKLHVYQSCWTACRVRRSLVVGEANPDTRVANIVGDVWPIVVSFLPSRSMIRLSGTCRLLFTLTMGGSLAAIARVCAKFVRSMRDNREADDPDARHTDETDSETCWRLDMHPDERVDHLIKKILEIPKKI